MIPDAGADRVVDEWGVGMNTAMSEWIRVLRRCRGVLLALCVCLFAIWSTLIPICRNWEYFPEWVPVSRIEVWLLRWLFPVLFLCGLVPIALIAFADGLLLSLMSLISGRRAAALNLSLLVLTVAVAVVPFECRHRVLDFVSRVVASRYEIVISEEDSLIAYAAARYDSAIAAIEEYYADHGQYPPTLWALVPDYLPTPPGIYMKFGETLTYDPKSQGGWYVGHGPFTFELSGDRRGGWHGQTLKYCPIEDSSCDMFEIRIDDRWIFAYSSAL